MFLSYKEIKKINKDINKEINIGKKGINEEMLKKLLLLVKKKRALKIRVLKNCPIELEEIHKKMEKYFIVVQKRGRTFVIVDRSYLYDKQRFIKKTENKSSG